MEYLSSRLIIASKDTIKLIEGEEIKTLNINFDTCRVFGTILCVVDYNDAGVKITGFNLANNIFEVIYDLTLKLRVLDNNMFSTLFQSSKYIYHYINPLTGKITTYDISTHINNYTSIIYLPTEK